MKTPEPFREASLWSAPIKDLGLRIAGTPLESVIVAFEDERQQKGLVRVQPRYYLSTEWGVPFGTVAIAIPFYLARTDLISIQDQEIGFIEGQDRNDILCYLRHEYGHVLNYAYQLYEREDWVKMFGSITQPYRDDYRPVPFSPRHVAHLPGWYAQKHPDEDWAETFAVWMMPRSNWRQEYGSRPLALAKLDYCDRLLGEIREREPVLLATDLDEDVGDLQYTLEHYYRGQSIAADELPPGLDGALRAIFEEAEVDAAHRAASELITRLERPLMANIFRWTGHFPERTRHLLRFLARRAEELHQVYSVQREPLVITALTTLVTSLAMHFVLGERSS